MLINISLTFKPNTTQRNYPSNNQFIFPSITFRQQFVIHLLQQGCSNFRDILTYEYQTFQSSFRQEWTDHRKDRRYKEICVDNDVLVRPTCIILEELFELILDDRWRNVFPGGFMTVNDDQVTVNVPLHHQARFLKKGLVEFQVVFNRASFY